MPDQKGGGSIGCFIVAFLFCLLGMAVWMDLRTRKISNRLVGLGLWIGFIRNLYVYGWSGSFHFLLQISIPVLIFYLLFLMRAFGAGDIKLFSVIGSCIGLVGLAKVIVYSFLVGAVFSFLILMQNKNLYTRLIYFFNYVRTVLDTKCIAKYDYTSDGKQNFLHFSIAIFIGYCIYLCTCR